MCVFSLQASTPISKDYYKVHPLESSLQPIPLAEPFDADRKADLSLQERAELEQELLQMLREDREVQEDRGIRQDQRRHHSSKPRPQTHPLDLPVNTQQRDVPQQDSGSYPELVHNAVFSLGFFSVVFYYPIIFCINLDSHAVHLGPYAVF